MSLAAQRELTTAAARQLPIHPPQEVVEIAQTLERAGFETWCVGGAVRDAMLGRAHLDWDFATAATPNQVRRLFARTVPVGIAFGTIGVLDPHGVMHEVTTFRRDVRTDGRHAVVEFGASLDEDLARRDFTINAIAYSPTRRALHDPFAGVADMERKLIRAVGDPRERMREDRLRALRAIRFAARYGFEIDEATWRAIAASAPELPKLSAERVKQEIEKTMQQVARPGRAFRLWRESGALASLVPALTHLGDVTLDALDQLPLPTHAGHSRRRTIRLTVLFSAAEPLGVAGALRDLRFANTDIKWIADTIQRWALLREPMTAALLAGEVPSAGALRRWAATSGRTRAGYVFRVAAAHWAALRARGDAAPSEARVCSVYRRFVHTAYRDPIAVGDLAIDGSDLERLGLSGPAVGKMLQSLLARVIEDPSLNTVEDLRVIAAAPAGSSGSAAQRPAAN